MDKSKEVSKKRILTTAARIFAQKGYSGARMDEIAREAKVNKALIYYYFKSKEAILNELFSTFFRESTDLLLRFVERGGFTEDADKNKKLFESEYESYLESNSDLITIVVMESLKSDTSDAPLFRLVDLGRNEQDVRIKEMQDKVALPEDEMQKIMVTEFFTGVMPFVAYIVLKDKWCNHFRISAGALKAYFDAAMQETHEQYHLKHGDKAW